MATRTVVTPTQGHGMLKDVEFEMAQMAQQKKAHVRFAYYSPREIRQRQIKAGAAAIRLRKHLAALAAIARVQRTAEDERLYQQLVSGIREGIADADSKARRIAAALNVRRA